MSSVAAPGSVGPRAGSRAGRGRGSPQSSSSASASSAGSGSFRTSRHPEATCYRGSRDVLNAFWDSASELWPRPGYTFTEAFGGFVLGVTAAIAAALVLARFRPLGNGADAVLRRRERDPVIAFAPITNAWFGTSSPGSKIFIAALLCFFPVLVNTLRGLTSVQAASDRADALVRRSASAAVFWQLRIPTSLPLPLHGAQGRERARDDRRDRRRVLRRLDSSRSGSRSRAPSRSPFETAGQRSSSRASRDRVLPGRLAGRDRVRRPRHPSADRSTRGHGCDGIGTRHNQGGR